MNRVVDFELKETPLNVKIAEEFAVKNRGRMINCELFRDLFRELSVPEELLADVQDHLAPPLWYQNARWLRKLVVNTLIKEPATPVKPDLVNEPPHYKAHPSGVQCIEITEHMNFCLGNAVKYIWRAGEKGNELEDLKKARWYLDRYIKRKEGELK